MYPNLLNLIDTKRTLDNWQLVDPALLPAPTKQHRTSLYLAWLWDMGLAYIIATAMITAWLEFMATLVLPFVSPATEYIFLGSAESLTWVLTSVVHFSLTFWALSASGQTFGMKIFKHVASDQGQTLSWQQAMLYAAGSTVSFVTAGLAAIALDHLALTTTQTEAHHHWQFQAQVPVEVAPYLVATLPTWVAEEFKHAA